jgi:hypothetical protein
MNQNWGSGNIKDTKVDIIKNEVACLIQDLQNKVINVKFEEKYKTLYSTSRSLFNLALKDGSSPTFNKSLFDEKLDKMLDYIKKIQESHITQETASQEIGQVLASEYIPQCK